MAGGAAQRFFDGVVLVRELGLELVAGRGFVQRHVGLGRLAERDDAIAHREPAAPANEREVSYGYLHGYRWLDAQGTAPAYPFGFGLGYTTFSYDALALSSSTVARDGTLTATVDVTNTGVRTGRETVQLYVRVLGSSVERAEKDLRAFAQVELAPGETGSVVLELAARDLAYWNTETNEWVVEATEYEVLVGPNAADLPLTASFRVQ
jgi:beta-glucosidase